MAADTDRLKGEVTDQIDSGEERVEFLMRHFVQALLKEQNLPEIIAPRDPVISTSIETPVAQTLADGSASPSGPSEVQGAAR